MGKNAQISVKTLIYPTYATEGLHRNHVLQALEKDKGFYYKDEPSK